MEFGSDRGSADEMWGAAHRRQRSGCGCGCSAAAGHWRAGARLGGRGLSVLHFAAEDHSHSPTAAASLFVSSFAARFRHIEIRI
jgi:hypothetical protein